MKKREEPSAKNTDGKGKKVNQAAFCSATIGVVGTLVWRKKDLLKAVAFLGRKSKHWSLIQQEPEVYLTKNTPEGQEQLFKAFHESPWRLVDQVADGFFWINEAEEILLLTRKPILLDRFCTWTASRSFERTEAMEQ